jgi:hypothetical protein
LEKKVITIIFLDIANTFPNAVTDHLLYNMEKLGYPMEIVDFYKTLLSDCSTHLKFDDFISSVMEIDNGISQGEPGSMILYLIYSKGLACILQGPNEDGGAYVDNNFILATGIDYEELILD